MHNLVDNLQPALGNFDECLTEQAVGNIIGTLIVEFI